MYVFLRMVNNTVAILYYMSVHFSLVVGKWFILTRSSENAASQLMRFASSPALLKAFKH